jgi:hypothetical protein
MVYQSSLQAEIPFTSQIAVDMAWQTAVYTGILHNSSFLPFRMPKWALVHKGHHYPEWKRKCSKVIRNNKEITMSP